MYIKKSVLVHDQTDIIQLNTIIITESLFTTLGRTQTTLLRGAALSVRCIRPVLK